MNIRIHTEDGASAPEDSKRRVIVLIDASADIMSLLVRAKKEAAFKNLPCQGVYVPAKPWRRSRLRQQQQNVSKAQELGIPVKKLAARSRLGIVGALRREHVHHPIDQLLISRRKRGLFFKWPFYMARRDGTPAFPVQVIDSFSSKRMKSMLLHSSHWDYIWTLVSVVGLSAIGYVLSRVLPLPIFSSIDHNIPFAYVVLIFVAAMRLGLGPAIFAATLSFFTYNYLFLVPAAPYLMVEATELINPLILLLTFFAAAVVGSILRERTQALSIRERRSRALNYFTQDIANTVELDQVLQMVGRSLKELLDFNVVIALPHATKPDALVPHAYGECRLSENETAAMYQSMQQKMIAGRSTPFFAGSRYVWIPMVTSQGILGVMGFEGEDQEILPDQRDFKATIVSQTALAVERTIIFSEMSRSLVREEREQLRSALLSSVSHDLKTPLASIIGSLSTVRHMGARLSASQQNELVDSAVDEAERLNSFITNILNMTRLEGEGVQLNQDWHDVRDVVEAACHRMKQNTRGRRQFKLEMPQQDDQIWIDPLLFDQVLQNLLDNAVKYSKPGTNIFISFRKERGKGGAVLTVKDEGVGIPTGKAHKIFDKFARLENRDRQVAGTGLGLSICKSIVEAHGFAIDVKNNKTVGSSFLIHIPSEFWRRGNVQQRA